MYNILITDDEQIVIDSLEFIIKKNFPGQVNLFSALSGSEAIDITRTQHIDILFMDINMPGLNGLEAVSCITHINPDTVIIILSAFDRFQYAQEAINLGAYKYITKPVNRNLVIQTIRGAMNLVDTRQGQLSDDQELHRKLDFVSPMVESDFIYSCVFSGEKNIDLTTYLDYFNIHETAWCFCCIEVPHVDSSNQYTVYMKIRDILNDHCRCLIGSFMLNRLVIFFPIAQEDSSENSDLKMQEQIKKVFTLLSLNITSGIRAGVSRLETDHTRTALSYSEALAALNRTASEGGLTFAGSEPSFPAVFPQTGELLNRIFNRLRTGDAGGVRLLVHAYCSALSDSVTNMDKIKNALFELLVNARNITTEINGSYHNDAFDNAFAILSGENDMTILESFVQNRLQECAVAVANRRTQQENPIIKKVCEYIRDHISENISLDQMALVAQVSPFYLSKLFKEEKGETFINYISDLRLEKAKQMLTTTTTTIKEISTDIGYNDQNYFSKLFKNKFGISPTEFRDTGKVKGV
jgi:two-component system, response regulator YesN